MDPNVVWPLGPSILSFAFSIFPIDQWQSVAIRTMTGRGVTGLTDRMTCRTSDRTTEPVRTERTRASERTRPAPTHQAAGR